jgi:hypothetical protein
LGLADDGGPLGMLTPPVAGGDASFTSFLKFFSVGDRGCLSRCMLVILGV